MEPLYTKEDLIDLIATSPPYNIINTLYLYVNKEGNDCRDIEEILTKEFPIISQVFFKFPLDIIPLLINHESNLIRAIALWRLRIAK